MISISGTDEWRSTHPGAMIGLLELSGVENQFPSQELNLRKRDTEARLRQDYAGFGRKDFLALPVMAAYEQYYRRFEKTYHVQLQVESIVLKGKSLPDVSPLVDANFAAEVETFILTAGHDVARLEEPVWIDVSRPGDEITPMNGAARPIRVGDMLMRDQQGIVCTILYGQDNLSPITPVTSHAIYVAYAPAGVTPRQEEKQLAAIARNICLFAPGCQLEQSRLIAA